MQDTFYPEGFIDKIEGDSKILLVKPNKEYDPTEDLKKLLLDKREVSFTYPKEGVELYSEVVSYRPSVVLQIGKPCTRKLPSFDGTVSKELEKKLWDNLTDKYINYHHHDEYSMRDALGTCKQLSAILIAQKRKFMSVSNHGNVGGWIKQGNSCKDNNLKCIYAMEAYHSNYRGDDPEEKKKNRSANHLILVAQNLEGYYNIIKIHNDAQLNGFYYSPRANDEALKAFGKGICGTSACSGGELARLVMQDRWEEAEARYHFYKSCFDEFYIEIQLIEMEEQKEVNRRLIQLAQKVNGKLIVGIDSHYHYPENSETHSLLMCIRQKRTIEDLAQENDDTWQFTVKNLYYRNFDQLYDLYSNGFINSEGTFVSAFRDDLFTDEVFYEVCMNTRKLCVGAEEIRLDTSIKLPKLYENSEEVLREKAWSGFKDFGFDVCENSKVYKDRLEYELDVICLSGWADYFLITKMIIEEAIRLKGEYATGAGRGSVSGSLVAYSLYISAIDPIKYNLLFERFLDFSRSEINVCTFEV